LFSFFILHSPKIIYIYINIIFHSLQKENRKMRLSVKKMIIYIGEA